MKPEIKAGLRRRYEFIEFQLMWEGAVGRPALKEKFDISLQQATNDLTAYSDMVPDNIEYDPRQRTYVARLGFTPRFIKKDASEYLLHLDMLHHGYRSADEIWPAHPPAFDVVTAAARKVEPRTLQFVLKAIREQRILQVSYVSLSSDSDEPRHVLPHAIASDGHRWHMRAYDIEKERHSDFVLSRLDEISLDVVPSRQAPLDESWRSIVELRLCPDPSLSQRRRERLELEYDMENGELCVHVRKAMLWYYLRFYGFDPASRLEDGPMANKSSFHLHLANLEEVEANLGRRS
jgi:predicted DNA-binding transcriptional regulator YafY